MTNQEHTKLVVKGRIEKLTILRDSLIATTQALYEVLVYDDQHLLKCKHGSPTINYLESAQREKEDVERQIDLHNQNITNSSCPKEQADFIKATFILPLENRLRHINEDILDIQNELEKEISTIENGENN